MLPSPKVITQNNQPPNKGNTIQNLLPWEKAFWQKRLIYDICTKRRIVLFSCWRELFTKQIGPLRKHNGFNLGFVFPARPSSVLAQTVVEMYLPLRQACRKTTIRRASFGIIRLMLLSSIINYEREQITLSTKGIIVQSASEGQRWQR